MRFVHVHKVVLDSPVITHRSLSLTYSVAQTSSALSTQPVPGD